MTGLALIASAGCLHIYSVGGGRACAELAACSPPLLTNPIGAGFLKDICCR